VTFGFIGLGHQGTPMAERMIDAGLRPWLWARRTEVLGRYEGADARLAASPAELGARCDVVGLCLYDARATDSVLFGVDGLMAAVRPGTVLALHSTVGPAYVQDLAARVAERGVSVVDAPVSGGDAAAAGKLLVITGGGEEPCALCAPMFATYAGRVVHTGPLGSAQAAKLINNSLMTAITGLVFDAFDLGAALDVDRDRLGEVLAHGSAANPSVGIYLGLGADRFSVAAWPTLHKDVALARSLSVDTKILLDTATSTVAEMDRRRSGVSPDCE
jgi:3-hydroxyisobutyrate dehydrogenase-like beta-hydroxyacid dehydrogenase